MHRGSYESPVDCTSETYVGHSCDLSAFQLAPQPCTRETMGLLYFDLYTSRMFRCTGVAWEAWNYSQMQNQMLKTEGVAEQSAGSAPPQADPNRNRKDRLGCPEGEVLHLCG